MVREATPADRGRMGGSRRRASRSLGCVLFIAADGSLHPGTTVRVTPQSEQPTTGHRGHMPSEYLGIAATGGGVGVSWDAMRGVYPDNIYRFVPLGAFGG